MYLSAKEKENILKKFPNFELCYEKKSHNKVFKDVILAIPKGKKYFAWFFMYKGESICLFLQKQNNSYKIMNIEHKFCCFDASLCIGTLVYGTVIKVKHQEFFVVEDIYYYKNKFIGNLNLDKKINYLELFYNHLKEISIKNFIIFSHCLMEKKYKALMNYVYDVDYEIYCLQHRSLYTIEPYINTFMKEKHEERIASFKVVAENQNDIYSLYCYDRGEKYHDSAYVSNYENSVFLNSLFRKIKENIDLDALEESDEEQEFENINDDKYIKNKSFVMDCKYIKKFKKWEPFRLSKQRKLITFKELKNI